MSKSTLPDQAFAAAAALTAAVIAKGATTPTPADAVRAYFEVLDGIADGLQQREKQPTYPMYVFGKK